MPAGLSFVPGLSIRGGLSVLPGLSTPGGLSPTFSVILLGGTGQLVVTTIQFGRSSSPAAGTGSLQVDTIQRVRWTGSAEFDGAGITPQPPGIIIGHP